MLPCASLLVTVMILAGDSQVTEKRGNSEASVVPASIKKSIDSVLRFGKGAVLACFIWNGMTADWDGMTAEQVEHILGKEPFPGGPGQLTGVCLRKTMEYRELGLTIGTEYRDGHFRVDHVSFRPFHYDEE